MPVSEYFNTGLFIINRRHHAPLLQRAMLYRGEYTSLWYEQGLLNVARHRMRAPLHLLPRKYNWLGFDHPPATEDAIVGHFTRIGEMPSEEATAYFRSWQERAALWNAAEKKNGVATYETAPPSAATFTPPPPMPDDFSSDSILGHQQRLAEVLATDFSYPIHRYEGRGIVICGGGVKYLPCAWVCVRMLRWLGCTLPIELWHLGAAEMPEAVRELLAPHGVTCIDARSLTPLYPARRLNGWELKCYAILHSQFAEVLLLDADNVPVLDPTYLFDTPEYREKGAVLWPDFERLHRDRPIWEMLALEYRDEPETESGQLLINKAASWRALNVAWHLNDYSDFYYRYFYGDKETFHLGWRVAGAEYAQPQRGIYALPATMCQHDFQGQRVFQHRNFAKWTLHAPNRRIHGFHHEEQCLAFLDELRAGWDGLAPGLRRWRPDRKSDTERAAAEQLCVCDWDYHRVGYDRRPMHFLPNGTIGEGAERCETLWDVREHAGRLWLEIFGTEHKTLAAALEADGAWRGRWLHFERMPVEISASLKNRETFTGSEISGGREAVALTSMVR